MSNKFQKLLQRVIGYPADVPAKGVASAASNLTLTPDQVTKAAQLGAMFGDMSAMMAHQTLINFERVNIYREVDRALTHPIMGAAAEYYAETATSYNRVQNATVWIDSESRDYRDKLTKMLESINIEERIFDWAYSTASFGDLFVKVNARPGIGIVSVDDDDHPANTSRVDYEGRLIGFFKTPLGSTTSIETAKLLPPWEYTHLRLLGVKKKRPMYDDPMYSEYRTITVMVPETKQLTSKYGTSILLNGLPIYKRLRLAEDSLMMARLSKGVLKYIYKVKVTGSNFEAVNAMVEQYKVLLKRARAMNTNPNSSFFSDKPWDLAVNEDIILPVFGETNDITFDKIGGETDIHWIADIEELRNQLAIALRVPLQLLGGYIEELPGSLGKSSADNLDIRFARSARRLQRAQIEGIKRLCQIHLAYLNMNPDASLFNVNMAETSTAEEAELRDALDKSADVVDKLAKLIIDYGDPTISRNKLLDYLNKKLLKLNDLDLESLCTKVASKIGEAGVNGQKMKAEIERVFRTQKLDNGDLCAFLPGANALIPSPLNEATWRTKYENMVLKVETHKMKGA